MKGYRSHGIIKLLFAIVLSVCGAGAVKFHFNCEKESETNEIGFL